tara:strand:+ start:114 stop:560 length:447 start_codon:yes stop_codon:yes gene_type:complete
MNNKTNITASGIIVFRNKNNNPELLGLVALPRYRKRSKGIYDIPKGRIDDGETAKQSAFRECLEESGLTPTLINEEPVVNGALILWIGEVSSDDEVILVPNPYTGEYEHEGYVWIGIKEMKNSCLNYLRPAIIEAEKEIWNHLRIWSK